MPKFPSKALEEWLSFRAQISVNVDISTIVSGWSARPHTDRKYAAIYLATPEYAPHASTAARCICRLLRRRSVACEI